MSLEDEIDLNLCELPSNLGARGRQPANVTSEFVRELTVADLNAPIVKTQTAPAIKDIKDRHHALARVLATGESEGNASAITGYSQSTAIDEVEAYRKRMVMVGQSALNELADRLEEKPETFTPGTLKDIAKDLADRVGLAPNGGGSKSVNVNISLRDAMADARARVEAHRQSKVIDHE
jgi:hypothetical protein